MKVIESLDLIRDSIIAGVEEFGHGNCIVTATPALMGQISRLTSQVYYNGSNFPFDGGGELFRSMNIGVRIYSTLAMDSVGKYEKQSREILRMARSVVCVVHMMYDVKVIPLHEPVKITSETGMRRVAENPSVWYIEQEYRLIFVSSFTALKDPDA